MRLKISVAAYNEIATALERLGVKADGTTQLTLEKGTQLSCPIDFKMVTIRRDIVDIASKTFDNSCHGEFVDYCKKLTEWILSEEKSETKSKGWK